MCQLKIVARNKYKLPIIGDEHYRYDIDIIFRCSCRIRLRATFTQTLFFPL